MKAKAVFVRFVESQYVKMYDILCVMTFMKFLSKKFKKTLDKLKSLRYNMQAITRWRSHQPPKPFEKKFKKLSKKVLTREE